MINVIQLANIFHTLALICTTSQMQNALNDIESLKKEGDDLKVQVESYITSLEAMCMGKAKLEEKLHSMGVSSHGL